MVRNSDVFELNFCEPSMAELDIYRAELAVFLKQAEYELRFFPKQDPEVDFSPENLNTVVYCGFTFLGCNNIFFTFLLYNIRVSIECNDFPLKGQFWLV